MKKALASDFDNTLYFMDTEERFRAQDVFEILFFRKEGGVFGICTGRSPDSILETCGSFLHPDFIISVSGALIVDGEGKVLDSHTLSPDTARAILRAGHVVHSSSSAALMEGLLTPDGEFALDLICGKQVTTPIGGGAKGCRFQVFPAALRKVLQDFSVAGGNLIVSGADIGTDLWDKVFPIQPDPSYTEPAKVFAETVLGYRWGGNYASRIGTIRPVRNSVLPLKGKLVSMEFWKERNQFIYNVETPDALEPANVKSIPFLRYGDTGSNAGLLFDTGTYKAVTLGFPIETMKNQEDIDILLAGILNCLRGEK